MLARRLPTGKLIPILCPILCKQNKKPKNCNIYVHRFLKLSAPSKNSHNDIVKMVCQLLEY